MELKQPKLGQLGLRQKLLQWVNLRSEESERTFLMFVFYTTTSMGLVWMEASTVALFLQQYKAEEGLPWIYIASAAISSGLGVLYSQLQKFLPLRRVILLMALLMAAPLGLFWWGLTSGASIDFLGFTLVAVTVFVMRLWLEAVYVLNDLNTAITANQLFNIREIKRTYPIISSGILVADVISGFSLSLLVSWIGLNNVILLAGGMMTIGAIILLRLSRKYRQFFPNTLRRRGGDRARDYVNRRVQGPLQRYVVLVFTFFILAQVLFLLVDFQFLSQLQNRKTEEEIAIFLGLFNGILGIFELAMQWLASSRVIERLGVFATAILIPGVIGIMAAVSAAIAGFSWSEALFTSLILLKFLDELLHYTLFASVGPVLFQPMPDLVRSGIQSVVRGIAEPLATGATGLALLGVGWLGTRLGGPTWLLPVIVVLTLLWMLTIWLLRARYVRLLVLSAERGQLSGDVDLRELKRAVIEALDKPGTEEYKSSCIELLSQLDPKNVGEVLAPLLTKLPTALQYQSLEEMLMYPNPAYLPEVGELVGQSPEPRVVAAALRYVWLTQDSPDVRHLKPYLRAEVDPEVRGTAASLMLRRGNSTQKAEATNTLRRMLTHQQERERVMGCRALGEAVYLQALRLYIPTLLQDPSLRVRCALLEAIAATHLEEFYPSLLKGLHYKSTRESAMRALVRLENEALPFLVNLADDVYQPDVVRFYAWKVIGEIGTIAALDSLIDHVITAWGTQRRNLMRILLEVPNEVGIESVLDRLGRSGVEQMIDQELMFMAHLYAASVDLSVDRLTSNEADLLRAALQDLQVDAEERLFAVMKFLYPIDAIKAAAFSLQSHSRNNIAQGLEILDNTLDFASKRALLAALDRGTAQEKLQSLSELVNYQPLAPRDRLRYLLDLRHQLSDWALACCFHVARQARWSLTSDPILAGLRHPKGFVREAVLDYLRIASPRALKELLPTFKTDPNPIVADLVQQIDRDLAGGIGRPGAPSRNGMRAVEGVGNWEII